MATHLPPPVPRPTVTYANCTFSVISGFRPLQLDVHLPPGDGPFATVLWVHGGGWMEGSRQWLPESIEPFGLHDKLLARGYAVADVDYRLALEATYPAQLSDVQAAVRWLRAYSDELRLDPARFAALGESAGGHLAAMAGLTMPIQAVVDWYGVSDLYFGDVEDPLFPPARLLGGPIAQRRELARSASPLHHVHPGAPPFLLMHGTQDQVVPYDQSVRMAQALRAQGVRADLYPVPDADHCFVGYPDIGGLLDASIDFLDDTLGGLK